MFKLSLSGQWDTLQADFSYHCATSLSILGHFHSFWHNRSDLSDCYYIDTFPSSVLESACSLRSLVPFGGEWFLEAKVCFRYTHCSWSVVAPRQCQWPELRVCLYVCMYAYTLTCIHIHICTSVYWKPSVHTSTLNSNLSPQGSFWCSLFLIFVLLTQWESWGFHIFILFI